MKFPTSDKYVVLLDFFNMNDDGKEVSLEVVHSDGNRRQNGKVYLYKCNITLVSTQIDFYKSIQFYSKSKIKLLLILSSLCREVFLSNDLEEPLVIDGKESANFVINSPFGSGRDILTYQLTLVPKEKFDINLIKMSPKCIVKNRK
jgi:hypothetical protein